MSCTCKNHPGNSSTSSLLSLAILAASYVSLHFASTDTVGWFEQPAQIEHQSSQRGIMTQSTKGEEQSIACVKLRREHRSAPEEALHTTH